MSAHTSHPRCPSCSRPLYKAYDGPWNGHKAPKVGPTMPYVFCRNLACAVSGAAGVERTSAQAARAVVEKRAKTEPPKAKPIRRARPVESKPAEHPAVSAARLRIRELVREITKGHPPVAVGLTLALVNQETGSHAAANVLIDEFRLDKLFGLERWDGDPNKVSTQGKKVQG